MTSISQAAVAASVLVGLVSIPAASSSVNIQGAFNSDLPDISESENVPREVTQMTSQDGFMAEVETAFKRFTTSTSADKANASLESARAELDVSRKPSETVWTLTTSKGTLTVRSASSAVEEVTETPQGTLKKVEQNGAVTTSFEGNDREAVEEAYRELRDMMERQRKKIESQTQQLVSRNRPDVEVVVNETIADEPEHAVIINQDLEEVNLEGWKLSDKTETYTFQDLSLEPGESVKVMSNEEWRGFEGTEIAWNNNSPETATLEDQKGREVDTSSY